MAEIGVCTSPTGVDKRSFTLVLARTHKDFHRFVDRDMMMRYYGGLGVGHLYPSSAQPLSPNRSHPLVEATTEVSLVDGLSPVPSASEEDKPPVNEGAELEGATRSDGGDEDYGWCSPDLRLGDREGDCYDNDSDSDADALIDHTQQEAAEEFSDDETFLSYFAG